MSLQQRRKKAADRLKADPQQTDVQIGLAVGLSDKTVASVRAELVARSEIPSVDERVDSRKRRTSARKPRGDPFRPLGWLDPSLRLGPRKPRKRRTQQPRTPAAACRDMENEMSKESLLKLLLEDTPVDELREVIQEIVKRDETLRQAIIMEKVNEAVAAVEKLEAEKRRRKARS